MSARVKVKDERMTDLDFMLGTLNGAAETEPGLMLRQGDRRVDAAFHAAYQALVTKIDSGEVTDVEPAFGIYPDQLHGDSETVFKGMGYLAYLGYVKRQGHSSFYRFDTRFDRTAEEIYESIPSGSPELFKSLGKAFLEALKSE